MKNFFKHLTLKTSVLGQALDSAGKELGAKFQPGSLERDARSWFAQQQEKSSEAAAGGKPEGDHPAPRRVPRRLR